MAKEVIKEKKDIKMKQFYQIDEHEPIRIINNRVGCLIYNNRQGTVNFEISEYGGDYYIYFKDLREMRSSKLSFINQVWIIIDDERLIEMWNLENIYNGIIKPDEIDDFFDLEISEMKNRINKMIPHQKVVLAEVAYSRYLNGQLDSVKKQKAINEVLGRKIFNPDIDILAE